MNEPTVSSRLAQMLTDEKDGEATARTLIKQGFLADAVDGLFHARHDAGLTLEQMAQRLGMTKTKVLNREGDTTGSMTMHQYADFALAYGMAPMLKLVTIEQARQDLIREYQEGPE